MYSRVETHLQMKTTTLVDISIKSNLNEQISCQRSGRARPVPSPLALKGSCDKTHMWNFTCRWLAGSRLSAGSVHPRPQLLDGSSRCNVTFAGPCSDEALQFKGCVQKPNDLSPLVLACFLASHLRCKLSGLWYISARTYINEGTP